MSESVKSIGERHPYPWSYQAVMGQVHVFDANGNAVQLFTLLDFAVGVTAVMARNTAPAEPAAAG